MLAVAYDYVSYEEFLLYSKDNNLSMEYFNGEIICMSPTHPKHNKVQNELYFQLRSLLDCGKCDVYTSDVAVKFEVDEEKYQFEPDVMVVCDDKFTGSIYTGVPKLVIEVLSKATEDRDLGIKLDVYERCGVEEYWIVDINKQEITVYKHNVSGNFKYRLIYGVESELIWNGKSLKLEDVFKGIM